MFVLFKRNYDSIWLLVLKYHYFDALGCANSVNHRTDETLCSQTNSRFVVILSLMMDFDTIHFNNYLKEYDLSVFFKYFENQVLNEMHMRGIDPIKEFKYAHW